MSELTAYFNGEFIPESECKVHIADRGFRYGDGVFDIQRTFDGKPFRVREHLERFMRSLKYARFDTGLIIDDWEDLTYEIARRNDHLRNPGGELHIGQYVSRGIRMHALDPAPLTISVRPWHMQMDRFARGYVDGVHAVFVKTRSYAPDALDSKVKHNNRLNMALAQLEASDVDRQAYPLMQDGNGNITENVQGNVWVVRDGVMRTPKDTNALLGDAGVLAREIAERLGIPVEADDLQPYDAYTADEMFFTNTTYGVLPIRMVDNRPIGTEIPGPVATQLLAAWSDLVGYDLVAKALAFQPPERR